MFDKGWKNDWNIFCGLFKLQFAFWSQNVMNLFLGLGVSLYTMVCWLAFKSSDPFLMMSGVCVGLVRNACHIQVKTFSNFREEGFTERLTLSPAPQWIQTLTSLVFNIFSTALICTIMFAVAMIFFQDQRALLPNANQGMVWSGLVLCWITSYVVASVIYIYIKNEKISQMTGLMVYFTTMYFLGLGFPFEVILNVKWLNYLLYLHPFRYVINIVQCGFVNATDFIYTKPAMGDIASYDIDFGYNGLAWLPYILALAMILIYAVAFQARYLYLYSFHKRNKYGEFIVDESSSRYIHQVKSAKSIDEVKTLHRERMINLASSSDEMKTIVEQVERESRTERWFKKQEEQQKQNQKE
ncbi:hypothetical protein [Mesoplasma lactucae]|uniref:Uncharacterized protein n=1 Tax=Mesoplasma lactucae ATCC 49193 TaxID=81460 RepID=A0A291IRV1_9MOLU|nr:hypothetical protein [Mesoplasma lactucae]ATG97480.1 hypothetical protein CP520_01780 [Mesoplasma lactucae ATCC 49193]ATZ20065.1 ABC transporter permease [Mesoplasma lactucae ATCC 49193]MCL8216813.1 hypothetical protein [Mesoplasma lactucae ATCC 49193]